jgi:DNA-binding transcriptional LysR family regulator
LKLFNALIALKAVAEKGTLKGAADALNRVPSAISYQIRKLEQQVGAKLLEKTGKRVIFTPAGRALMKQIPDLMDAMQHTIQSVQQVAHGWEASLTIAIECIIPLNPILDRIKQFQSLEAPTTVHLRREVLAGTWDALLSGRADLAIGAVAPIPEQFHLKTRKLPGIPLVMCCAADYPLAEQAGKEDIDYNGYPMIVVRDTSAQLPRRKIRVRENPKNITVTTLHDKLEAQLDGIGYGLLPLWLAQPYLDRGELVALEAPEQSPELFIAWRKTDKGRALQWFLENLQTL